MLIFFVVVILPLFFYHLNTCASQVAQWQRILLPMQEMRVPDWEDSLEKEVAAHSSILACRTPWTEEPGGLQSTGSQRVVHNLAIKQQQLNT